MANSDRPKRLPIIDPVTGIASFLAAMSDTVMQSRQPLLEVHNLTTCFDVGAGWLGTPKARVHAVENVSFSISAGETLALVGESGCGKSTTGRSIARLVESSQGDILLDGLDILKMSKRDILQARRKVQMIFQDPFSSLNPRMSVGSAIAEPLLFHRLAPRRDFRTASPNCCAALVLRRTWPSFIRMSSRAGSASVSVLPGCSDWSSS